MTTMVTVNGKEADLKQVVRDQIISEQPLFEKAIEGLLVRQMAAHQGVTVSDAELQTALDEARYLRGLESAEKTMQWMRSRNIDLLSVQNFLEGVVLGRKLREAITAEEIAAYYNENLPSFDGVELYSIRVGSEGLANELMSQITEEDENFHVLAMEHSTDTDTVRRGGYVGWVTRGQVTGEIEAAVFSANIGEVVGPIKTSKGYNLFKVTGRRTETLESSDMLIREILFAEKIAKLRMEAIITYPLLAD